MSYERKMIVLEPKMSLVRNAEIDCGWKETERDKNVKQEMKNALENAFSSTGPNKDMYLHFQGIL